MPNDRRVLADYRPHVVFHTPALKHLPLLEMYPDEGWKTNVCGTLNLLRAASSHGVERFVNVSTDKAAAPTSVLGWTKRWDGAAGERIACVIIDGGPPESRKRPTDL